MKTIIFFILFILVCASIFSQNITNTLGASGLFRIRDNATIYLTLQQSDGLIDVTRNLRLANVQGSQNGVIFKGTSRFLHNYAPAPATGFNTFLGIDAGNFTMSGTINSESSFNTGVGSNSIRLLTTGSFNSAFGHESLSNNTSGSRNTAIGYASLNGNVTGTHNTSVGSTSLINNSSGIQNTAIGTSSGSTVTTGSNLTLLGNDAEPSTGTISNQITLGNNQITSLRCNVTTISSLSDARDKKNIKDLPLGLDFISKLKPRLFNWDRREWYDDNKSDGTKMQETPTAGFIAQELDEVQTTENAGWLNLVLKDNPEKFEATPGNLLPIMVKAIQELKAENDELEERLAKLEQLINNQDNLISVINE